jgi:hypothetical protein
VNRYRKTKSALFPSSCIHQFEGLVEEVVVEREQVRPSRGLDLEFLAWTSWKQRAKLIRKVTWAHNL